MFGHVTDIGGKVACSMPNDAHSIFEVSGAAIEKYSQHDAFPPSSPLAPNSGEVHEAQLLSRRAQCCYCHHITEQDCWTRCVH